MLLEHTKDQLRTLKLTGFLEALEQQLEQPHTHELAFENRLGLLVEREVLYRDNRRLARLLSNAKLRESACVEDIDYAHPRVLDKSRMASQLPVKHWHDYIGEATMSNAFFDRLLHGAHRLELRGDSMSKQSVGKAKKSEKA